MTKLTVRELQALKPEDDGRTIRDDGGLVGTVNARAKGVTVSFDWRYRFDGKVRQIQVGTWPKLSLPQIRKELDGLRRLVEEGRDPAEERRIARLKEKANQAEAAAKEQARLQEIAAQQARMTVTELFEKWERLELSGRKDKGKETRRAFDKDVLPVIGGMAAEDVDRKTVAAVLDTVVERGARIVARNLLGDIRQMFGFAIVRGLLEYDPTAHMKRDDFGKKVERDRVLSEAEIRELRAKLPGAKLLRTTEIGVWLMLATCVRVGELSRAKWADVDLEAGVWTIPAENSKNAKAHRVFLSAFAVRQFKALAELTGPSAWCYPSDPTDDTAGHICLKSLSKQIRDRQRLTPLKNRSMATGALLLADGEWVVHDLRRTGATLMGELGVLPEAIERCLNHVEQNKVKRIYQRHSYDAAMQRAWRLLGERLEALSVDNVIPLNRSAG